jgi:hypothetical protein
MPAKSRRNRGKQTFRSKKKREKLSPLNTQAQVATQAQITAQTDGAVSPKVPQKPAPVTITAVRYPDILPELRRIGILAGIIIVILIVLALVW